MRHLLDFKPRCVVGLLIVAGGIGASLETAQAGADDDPTSLIAPEVLDIDDPFRRGLDRIAEISTNGVTLPDSRLPGRTGDQAGALLGQPDDAALLASRYRVIGVAVSRREANAQIFAATNQDVMPGDKPMLAYSRLGLHEDDRQAKQVAVNLKAVVGDLLGANFVMRIVEDEGVILDVGPMRGVVHAERYCELLLTNSNGIVTDCHATLEYPGNEPTQTFTSTAMLRSSPQAVRSIIQDDDLFDLEMAATRLMTLREGDMLGNGSVNVVKVTPDGIITVAENGDVDILPIDYIPERPFQAATSQPIPQDDPPANET